jgi:peptidoglycan/xylan/chitin deacetylase (PgdA/CDA1 family)
MRISIRPERFMRQIDGLASKYPIISLSEAETQCRNAQAKSEIQAVLTFDDGYWDNYEVAFPVLMKRGLPAAFFLPSDYIDGKAEFSDKRMMDKKTGKPCEIVRDRFITWDQARKMASAGAEIGSHGLTHRSLTGMPIDEAKAEIVKSKAVIEDRIHRRCDHFAFPFGSRSDYSKNLIGFVREAGYKICLLNIHGYNHVEKAAFCLKRIIMEESTSVKHLLG